MTPSGVVSPDDEESFVRRLIEMTGGERSLIGDDAAVLEAFSPPLLYTTDTVQKGVHYDETFTPREIGLKLAGINLSDIAAMGGTPRWGLLTLASNRPPEEREALVQGVLQRLDEVRVRLVGGDVSGLALDASENVSLSLLGRSSSEGVLRRGRAQPGDYVAVSGPLGGPSAVLDTDPAERTDDDRRLLHDIPNHLDRARQLVGMGIRCGMDVSDGLVKDLRRICRASGVGARIHTDRLPVHPRAGDPDDPDEDALRRVLGGGEDFELLVAVPPEMKDEVTPMLVRVGQFTEDETLSFDPPLPFPRDELPEGYDHFRSPGNP